MKDSNKEAPISKTGEVFPWQSIRLPSSVSPIHYKLWLHPNLKTFHYAGNVVIFIKITNTTKFIVLHCKEITIKNVKVLTQSGGEELSVVKILEYAKNSQLYIEVDRSLNAGEMFYLDIDFENKLNEVLEGFYLSSYLTASGEKRYLATTHFEPTYARMAFPCFDEPAMKATFQLTVVHQDTLNAYFNTNISKTSSNGDGSSTTIFEKTVKMSTYLVAFIICDFKERLKETEDGVKIRMIAPPDQIDQVEFALNTACKILPFYNCFFGVKYPLSKLDMVAVPDFNCGAMENWGLITFRQSVVLCKPEETSGATQIRISKTIAHELAHQWFGNLVTMEWWDDLWLNEGFASFVENLGANHAYPEFSIMDLFIRARVLFSLSQDCFESSHPVLATVSDPSEIGSIFDSISYSKGSSILYMLQDSLGMDVIQEGLKYYLNKHQFSNARTEDLWNAFTNVVKGQQIDVAKVMDSWTRQKGYPLLHVSKENNVITVKQQRFLLLSSKNNNEADNSPFDYKWFVPVSYITNNDKEKKKFWLNMSDGQFSVSSDITWVKLNVNQSGYYRVMYDEELWLNLIKQLQIDHEVFSAVDRSGLLDDAFTLARAGKLKISVALDLSKYLKKERHYVPWVTALEHFEYLHSVIEESAAVFKLEKYVSELLKPLIQEIGWKDEGPHLTKLLRSVALSILVDYKDEETVKEAQRLFYKWMNDGENVSSNLRKVVYQCGIKFGGRKEWQFCWETFQKTLLASEKPVLLFALGQTQDLWQLTQFTNYSLDKDKIKPQDSRAAIQWSAQNPIGKLLTWRFVRMNWQIILNLYGDACFAMANIISSVISSFNTEFDYNDVKLFFSHVEVGTGKNALVKSLEKIQANIQCKDIIESYFVQWLEQNVY